MTCRYDRDAGEHLNDGEPCKVDEYGDPTKHCTARRTCGSHIGNDELTCPRCIARARANLRRIPLLAALMMPVALSAGVDSQAANLAGPAADPEAWMWRKISARQGRAWHLSLIEDDDERHAYSVLGRWDMMIREDYDHPSDVPVSITNAAAYLDRQLARIANDDAQDFALFAREIRKCRQHLESVMADSRTPERGVPCPECTDEAKGLGPRLVREYGHWCDEQDCTKVHYDDDDGDRWTCPRDARHGWTHQQYTDYLEDRRLGA